MTKAHMIDLMSQTIFVWLDGGHGIHEEHVLKAFLMQLPCGADSSPHDLAARKLIEKAMKELVLGRKDAAV